MVSDPIADFIIRLKNASAVGASTVSVPYSKLLFAVAAALEKAGYLEGVARKGKRAKRFLEVKLVYDNGTPRIRGVRRASKLSRRVYAGAKDIRPVKQGFGAVIVTTPRGVMTGARARKERLGGEVLFEIW